jgi:hypothetical protein
VTDYLKSTGSTGQMMIRDTGTRVEFWLRAGSATFNHDLGWGFTVNGVTDNSNTFDFKSGGAWQMLRSWAVSSTQTVYFRLQDSGTSGLGGPTVHQININRATPPGKPSVPNASLITSTSVFISFSDGDNGGAAIDSRQIGRAFTSTGSKTLYSSDGSTSITGLTPGTKYYFWARTHNSEGYGGWSDQRIVNTLETPSVPGLVSVSGITQTTVVAQFTDADSGSSPILERQVGYSLTTSATPTTVLGYSGPTTITGLVPGTLYYFRSRTRNSVGFSAWSAYTTARTIAGAFVNVAGVWKPAIPYVKVAGVWKIARPWGRQYGYWEEST